MINLPSTRPLSPTLRALIRRLPGVSHVARRLGALAQLERKLSVRIEILSSSLQRLHDRISDVERQLHNPMSDVQQHLHDRLSHVQQHLHDRLSDVQRAQLAAQIDLADQQHWIAGASSRLDGLAQSFSEFTSGGIAQILDFRGHQLREDLTVQMRRHEADVKQAFEVHAGAAETRGVEFETRIASLERRLEEVHAGAVERQGAEFEARIASLEHRLEEVTARLAEMLDFPRDVPAAQGRELQTSRMIQDWVREEWSFLLPRTVVGRDLVRLGREGDGGYVLLDDWENVQACISAGVDTEISFDLALAERNVRVFMFDPAVSDIPARHPGLIFRQVAIGPQSDNGMITLGDIIQDHSINDYKRTLLKVDIEGAEWSVLNNPAQACLSQFSQIVIEFHGMTEFLDHADHLKRLYALRNLSQTHEIVHIHANNWGECAIIGGLSVPGVVETTWVRRSDHEFGPARYEFPTALDHPNNANWAEIAFSLRPLVVDAAPT